MQQDRCREKNLRAADIHTPRPRKRASDKYEHDGIVKYDEQQLKKISDYVKKTSDNFNQIAVRVNSTNRVYAEDIALMREELDEIRQSLKFIQSQLLKLKP